LLPALGVRAPLFVLAFCLREKEHRCAHELHVNLAANACMDGCVRMCVCVVCVCPCDTIYLRVCTCSRLIVFACE
jgi:hypothetical protein